MTVEIILNIVISILLAITVIMALKLGRKIVAFNATKEELAKFIGEFNEAINRAEKNINELKATGTTVDENLKSQIKKARFLANDLSFLAEKGENVATQLDEKISMSREMYRKTMVDPAINNNRLQNLNHESAFATIKPVTTNTNKEPAAPSKKNALDSLLKQLAKKREEINQTS